MEISGKRVLISGASRGLGRTLAFAFGAAGAREVLAGARQTEDFESLTAEATTAGLSINPIKLDVTSEDDVQAAARLGRVDILINNAGVASFGDPSQMTFADIEREIDVNYLGVLRMVRAFAPAMAEHGDGMIVNIATIFAKVNLPIVATYCATKAALLSLGQGLRAYLADKGVRVITVMPCTIDTDMSRGAEVPKMTKEFVAGEILRHIREETMDPPIGEEAERIYESLMKDPRSVEKMLSQIRA
ncbi:MAG: SDR family NAD(P)-dependent oxidoreductase [Pyrinomonadaceae bacterium]